MQITAKISPRTGKTEYLSTTVFLFKKDCMLENAMEKSIDISLTRNNHMEEER